MASQEFRELKKRSLYSKLKTLFSNDVIVRNVGGKKLKVVDTDEVMYATDRSFRDERFNRIRSSTFNQRGKDLTLSYHSARRELFRDYDTMDMDPIINSALDIYSDECLTKNELGDMLTIKSSNDNIKQILNNLFYDILNIEFNLWSWTRNLVKYGDFYLKLYISPEYGVFLVEPMSSYNVERIENSRADNKNYVKFVADLSDSNGKSEELENYQVAHFRLLSDSNFLPYGKSMLEGARRTWKQLSLMEDAMLIHRVMRAPEKRVFKVDVGNIPPSEVDNYMEQLISKTKKIPYIDENTGDYNLKFNLQNMTEDFYLPVRGSDSGTDISPLSGMEFTGIDDIEYLRNKMMAALKIPKAFLGYEEDISGKATLAVEDVRFSRTIQRIQGIIVSELKKIAIVHLYAQGYTDDALVDFSLELTNPSTIAEKEQVSMWQDKVNLANDMIDNNLFSKKWIFKNVFNMSDDDIHTMANEVVEDTKQTYRFTKIEEEGNDPAKPYNKLSIGGNGGGPESPGGGGGTDIPDIDKGNKPPDVKDEPKSGEPKAPEAPLSEKSYYKRPSQKGEKDASKYPYGEDPLGYGEVNRKPNKTTNPLVHKYKNNSPLSLYELESMPTAPKKSLIEESTLPSEKSHPLLDEKLIIRDEFK